MVPKTTYGEGQWDKHMQSMKLQGKGEPGKESGVGVVCAKISPAEGISRSYHHHR